VTNISIGHISDSFRNLWSVDDDPKQQGFNYAKEISKPMGTIDSILAWCRSELVGEWRWQIAEMASYSHPGRYIFYFDQERDQLAFVLKWWEK
jgi:hypothetical protein